MKQIMIILALVLSTAAFYSCGGEKKDTTKTEMKVDMSGPEYTSKYICPMYCEGSGSDKMGTCPVCKMDYELNEKYEGDANSDDQDHGDHDGHNHDGHDHGDHEGHSH